MSLSLVVLVLTLSPVEACRMECGLEMGICTAECAGAPGPVKEQNDAKAKSCTKTCSAQAQPCMKRCDKEQKAAAKGGGR